MDQSLNLGVCQCLITAGHLPGKPELSQSCLGDSEMAGHKCGQAAFVVLYAHAEPASHQLSTAEDFIFLMRAGSQDVKIPNCNPFSCELWSSIANFMRGRAPQYIN